MRFTNIGYFPLQQSQYTIQVVAEGDEPENFFWVGIGGRKQYDHVRTPSQSVRARACVLIGPFSE